MTTMNTIAPVQWLNSLHTVLTSAEVSQKGGPKLDLDKGLNAVQEQLKAARQRGGTVYWVGNGGSLAVCNHLSQDVLNKLKLRSIALSESSLLTCMANDFGYAEIYARPLQTLLRAEDLLIAISSSGKSQSIIKPVELCLSRNIAVIALSAFTPDNPLRKLPADVSIYLPCDLYGLAEVGHEAFLHAAIEALCLAEL
jgi:D-sedoheptulose 7-phosphate isomerase